MDLTSHDAQVVLRTIRFQLARAKRNHCALDMAALASRIARKHPRITDAGEIEGEIRRPRHAFRSISSTPD